MKTLVIVDVQKGFLKPEYAELPNKIRAHLEQKQYDHILFGTFVNKKNSNFATLLGWDKLYEPPETDIVPELIPFSSPERVFTRSTYSLFKSRAFQEYLNTYDIKQFDLCGLVADSCVLATAFEGFDLGYEVTVLRDLMLTKEGLNDPTEDIFKRNIDKQIK
ncbi:MAG: Isochorismatase [Parcubacteria group bacterium]|nr:Isochorismatase [Parcubacteria group bacterium]